MFFINIQFPFVRYFSSKNTKKNSKKKNINSNQKETILPKSLDVLKHYENFETNASYAKGAAASLAGQSTFPLENKLTVDQEKNKQKYIHALANLRMAQESLNFTIKQPTMYLASRVLSGDKAAQVAASRTLAGNPDKVKAITTKTETLQPVTRTSKRPKRLRNLYPAGGARGVGSKKDKYKTLINPKLGGGFEDDDERHDAPAASSRNSEGEFNRGSTPRGKRGGVKAHRRRLSVWGRIVNPNIPKTVKFDGSFPSNENLWELLRFLRLEEGEEVNIIETNWYSELLKANYFLPWHRARSVIYKYLLYFHSKRSLRRSYIFFVKKLFMAAHSSSQVEENIQWNIDNYTKIIKSNYKPSVVINCLRHNNIKVSRDGEFILTSAHRPNFRHSFIFFKKYSSWAFRGDLAILPTSRLPFVTARLPKRSPSALLFKNFYKAGLRGQRSLFWTEPVNARRNTIKLRTVKSKKFHARNMAWLKDTNKLLGQKKSRLLINHTLLRHYTKLLFSSAISSYKASLKIAPDEAREIDWLVRNILSFKISVNFHDLLRLQAEYSDKPKVTPWKFFFSYPISNFVRFLNFRAHFSFVKKLKRYFPKASALLFENFHLHNKVLSPRSSKTFNAAFYTKIRKYKNLKRFTLSYLLSFQLLSATYGSRFSPFVSNLHRLAVNRELKKTFKKVFTPWQGAVWQGSFPEYVTPKYDRSLNFFCSNNLFWKGDYLQENRKPFYRYFFRMYFFGTLIKTKRRQWSRALRRLMRTIDSAHLLKINKEKKNLWYIRERNANQELAALDYKFEKMYPWSVNYRLEDRKKFKIRAWDKRTRALMARTQTRFFDANSRYQVFSQTINKVKARQVNLKIFGKLLNTQFSKYLRFGEVEKFVRSSTLKKTHPLLTFYNATDFKLNTRWTPGVSGFFPHFSDNLHREYTSGLLLDLNVSAVFGWFRQTAKIDRVNWEDDLSLYTNSQEATNSPYSTDFNKFWNLNVYKYDIFNTPRDYKRVRGGLPIISTSFLASFESSVDYNFSAFYSCNKAATVKLANSLITSSQLSNSFPGAGVIEKNIQKVYSHSYRLFSLLKKRSKWVSKLYKNSFNSPYLYGSVLERRLKTSGSFYRSTFWRISSLLWSTVRRLRLKTLYDFVYPAFKFIWLRKNIRRYRYYSCKVAFPYRLLFNKSLLVLSALNVQRLNSLYNSWRLVGNYYNNRSFSNTNTFGKIFNKDASVFSNDFEKLTKHFLNVISKDSSKLLMSKHLMSNMRHSGRDVAFFRTRKEVMVAGLGNRNRAHSNLSSREVAANKKFTDAFKKAVSFSKPSENLIELRHKERKKILVIREAIKMFFSYRMRGLSAVRRWVRKYFAGISDKRAAIMVKNLLYLKKTLACAFSSRKKKMLAGAQLKGSKVVKEPLDIVLRRVAEQVEKNLRPIGDQRKVEAQIFPHYRMLRRRIPKALFYIHVGSFRSVIEKMIRGELTFEQLMNKDRVTRDLTRNKFNKPFIYDRFRSRFSREDRFKLTKLVPLSSSNIFTSPSVDHLFDDYSPYRLSAPAYSQIFTGQYLSSPLKNPSYSPIWKNFSLKGLRRILSQRNDLFSTYATFLKISSQRKLKRNKNKQLLPLEPKALKFYENYLTGYDDRCLEFEALWEDSLYAYSRLWSMAHRLVLERYPLERFFLSIVRLSKTGTTKNLKIVRNRLLFSKLKRRFIISKFVNKIESDALADYANYWNVNDFNPSGRPNYDLIAKKAPLVGGPIVKNKFNPKHFFKNNYVRMAGFLSVRFSIGDIIAQRLNEIKKYQFLKNKFHETVRKSAENLLRSAKEQKMFKINVEQKGRSIFLYFPQKRSWIQRRWNKPYRLIGSVSPAPSQDYAQSVSTVTSVYGLRKYINARKNYRGKHWRLKVFIKHILRRKFKCSMSALKTRWRIAKETKRKWYKYFDEFESRLASIVCLMGFYDDLDEARAAISAGAVLVNNQPCVNPDYKVQFMDVVSLEMQAYIDMRAERVADVLEEFCSTSDVTNEVKRRILGQAAEFTKKHAAVARLKREGFSVTRYLFFQQLLKVVVNKLGAKKSFRPGLKMRGGFVAHKDMLRGQRAGDTAYGAGSHYTLGDLGSGVNYEKMHVREAFTREDKKYTPARIKRILYRAMSGDRTGLSSSLESRNDIFYRFNNMAIYLRRPHTIYEMFDVSHVAATPSYNPYVIENFYSNRFEK